MDAWSSLTAVRGEGQGSWLKEDDEIGQRTDNSEVLARGKRVRAGQMGRKWGHQ